MNTVIALLFFCLSSSLVKAENKNIHLSFSTEKGLPSALLLLDNFFSHHVIIAEKSSHQLHLFENDGSYPRYVKSFQMVTGKKMGNKIFQGDFRTPEGAYFFTDFIPKEKLLQRFGKEGEIYGAGAFVMDYPNAIDSRLGKSGSGIWLHSTNDETRIEKGLDSRGCLVTANDDLKTISQYIELNRTAVVVVHDMYFLKESAWNFARKQITEALNSWVSAWQQEDLDKYMEFYHPSDFRDSKGNFKNYRDYKRAVFHNPGRPEIVLSDISILWPEDYVLVTFKQHYKSDTINDTGKKTLYLKRDEFYDWKIVSENWSKIPKDEAKNEESRSTSLAFRPSMRFFKIDQQAASAAQ